MKETVDMGQNVYEYAFVYNLCPHLVVLCDGV